MTLENYYNNIIIVVFRLALIIHQHYNNNIIILILLTSECMIAEEMYYGCFADWQYNIMIIKILSYIQ